MESLRFEVEPFGIRTTIVEPGFFRTELLDEESTSYAEPRSTTTPSEPPQTRLAWEAMNGKQGGDPAKLAKALVTIVEPRSRRCAGLQVPTPSRRSSRRRTTSRPGRRLPRTVVVPRASTSAGL